MFHSLKFHSNIGTPMASPMPSIFSLKRKSKPANWKIFSFL